MGNDNVIMKAATPRHPRRGTRAAWASDSVGGLGGQGREPAFRPEGPRQAPGPLGDPPTQPSRRLAIAADLAPLATTTGDLSMWVICLFRDKSPGAFVR